jgi:uncharacterized protein (DUF342 family)
MKGSNMEGITLSLDDTGASLELSIDPHRVNALLEVEKVYKLIRNSQFKDFFIFDDNLVDIISQYKTDKANHQSRVIHTYIGERRDAIITCNQLEDGLSAYLKVICDHSGRPASRKTIMKTLQQAEITRGIGHKNIEALLKRCANGKSGEVFDTLVAKGLPPKPGKPSQLKPLVENALERILKPQFSGTDKADMRNLGAIICVNQGAELLRRLPPTNGRNGYTVTGAKLTAKPGEWLKFRAGEGTVVCDKDVNLLLAEIAGMPKFRDQRMWVDDTYISNGVNVGSGNIEYEGAVLINGDVTENMEIIATGDVTVNGFVESANIQAGGDIIITEGAMGRVNENATKYSTKLVSKGSIHVQHGQGLDIQCNGNVTIGRQLAYSRIDCKGSVTAGREDKPNGNIFASTIKCHGPLVAGTLGAVAGSNLNVDFSDGFNSLLKRTDSLDDVLTQIKHNNERHLQRVELLNSKVVPKEMQHRVDDANTLLENETQLLLWLEKKAQEMKNTKVQYQEGVYLEINKRLYPGVVVKLNNRAWRADKEYLRSTVQLTGHKWRIEPLI